MNLVVWVVHKDFVGSQPSYTCWPGFSKRTLDHQSVAERRWGHEFVRVETVPRTIPDSVFFALS